MKKIRVHKINKIEDAIYGDILMFYPSERLFSKLIPFFDTSAFSHCAMYTFFEHGQHRFIESMDFKGVIEPRYDNERAHRIVIFRPIDIQAMPPSVVYKDLNKPYDRRKIWEILKHKLFGTRLTQDDDKAMICSEALNKWFNYKLSPKGHATPGSIYNNFEIV